MTSAARGLDITGPCLSIFVGCIQARRCCIGFLTAVRDHRLFGVTLLIFPQVIVDCVVALRLPFLLSLPERCLPYFTVLWGVNLGVPFSDTVPFDQQAQLLVCKNGGGIHECDFHLIFSVHFWFLFSRLYFGKGLVTFLLSHVSDCE